MNDYAGIADLYDSYVTDTSDHAFWSWCASRAGAPILEITAGTGRATVALREASDEPLVALDVTPAMLRWLLLRFRGGPRAVWAVGGDMRMLPFRGEQFGLVAIPFNSLGEVVEAPDRAAALREVRRVLVPGGRAVVTLHDPTRRRQTLDTDVRRLGPFSLGDRQLEVLVRGRALTTEVAESEQTYRVLDRMNRLLEVRHLTLRFALPDVVSLTATAEDAGLEVQAVYGDYDRSPYTEGSSRFIIAIMGRAQETRASR